MHSTHLGMTGNSGWYLLAAGGITILMVVFLWGILGVSLLLCLFVGVVLCGFAVAYVLLLKNNRPKHYDTDFFESALVESGLLAFRFGPRIRRPANPFAAATAEVEPTARARGRVLTSRHPSALRPRLARADHPAASESSEVARSAPAGAKPQGNEDGTALARLQEKLSATEEMLEEALAEREEDLP
jgi:hypothetical protein